MDVVTNTSRKVTNYVVTQISMSPVDGITMKISFVTFRLLSDSRWSCTSGKTSQILHPGFRLRVPDERRGSVQTISVTAVQCDEKRAKGRAGTSFTCLTRRAHSARVEAMANIFFDFYCNLE